MIMKLPIQIIAEPAWGVRFSPPAEAAALPLETLALPEELHVSLHQHSGVPAVPLVQPGDTVMRGQPIGGVTPGTLGAGLHAPTSGRITAIGERAGPGGRTSVCITIQCDGNDRRWPYYPVRTEPLRLPTTELRRAVIDGGIVGLGGATFPAGVKLNRGSGVKVLIINGAECEPVIHCDDALLQQEAGLVLRGAQIMLRILEADRCIVAIKSTMQGAHAALDSAYAKLQDDRFSLAVVPPLYPMGGEAQLIQLLTGQEIPAGGLPWDSGAICQNVATAAAVARMLYDGEPLIRRIVTVTGAGVNRPANFEVRLGTPIANLLQAAGGRTPDAAALIMGGPMMGISLASAEISITKGCNCIYVPDRISLSRPHTEQACIRCGDCASVCPAGLTPQLLLQAQRGANLDRLVQLGLSACIECGCCDYVCPSHIALTRSFVSGKHALWEQAGEQRRARNAEQRLAARTTRQAEETKQRETELAGMTTALTGSDEKARQALQELLQRSAKADKSKTPDAGE